jgi:hypothetical protein
MIQDTTESLQHIYREGIFARALGRPCSSNPYLGHTNEHFLWEKGWRLIDATPGERDTDQLGIVCWRLTTTRRGSPRAPASGYGAKL